MGSVRKTRTGVGLVEKQEWFARLIGSGMNNSQACRTVGVNRRTGTRWRYGRTIQNTAGQSVHYPPMPMSTPKERHPRYLSAAERTTIADLKRAGLSMRAIARDLGRSVSTISRELNRNVDECGRYLPATADRLATARQVRCRQRRVATDAALYVVVLDLLGRRWSPEQVSHELRVCFPEQPNRQLCTESIYQAIYDPAVPVTRPAIRRRRRRHRRVQGVERRGLLSQMRMIADRPAAVAERIELGHWEGDCIMGAENRSAIVTLVERVTRFLILVPVFTARPTASGVRDGIVAAMAGLPSSLRRTLTWDQGKELAFHTQITAMTGMDVYFCDAHSPWQRGTNENMNGLLRDYFPKRTDLRDVSAERLADVAVEVNARPRKSLGWAHPADLFARHVKSPPSPQRQVG